MSELHRDWVQGQIVKLVSMRKVRDRTRYNLQFGLFLAVAERPLLILLTQSTIIYSYCNHYYTHAGCWYSAEGSVFRRGERNRLAMTRNSCDCKSYNSWRGCTICGRMRRRTRRAPDDHALSEKISPQARYLLLGRKSSFLHQVLSRRG